VLKIELGTSYLPSDEQIDGTSARVIRFKTRGPRVAGPATPEASNWRRWRRNPKNVLAAYK